MFNFQDPTLLKNLNDPKHPERELVRQFLTLLSVCHTVIPEGSMQDGTLQYQAASPDEAALVAAAKCLGFVFYQRTPKTVEVSADGRSQEYHVLNVIEFNSDRKRMTVIVRNPEGQIVLYTKGADTKIFERLAAGQTILDITLKHLEEFASEGLRTLCCAMRLIEEDTWREWNAKYEEALTSLDNRKEVNYAHFILHCVFR
jgi:phospholipid-transporting ATPase